MLDASEARKRLRGAVEQEFRRLKEANNGQLEKAAKELGVKRQQMQQYAAGTTVPADVLLMVFLKCGTTIRVEDEHPKRGQPRWWEFSMSGRDKGLQKPRPHPEQMSLFAAIDDLRDDQLDVKILRKGPGRIELGLEIGFKKLSF